MKNKKRKSNKELQRLAEQIMVLEERLQQDKNDKDAESKIYNIMISLSFADMFRLDDLIQQNNLTK